MCGVIVAIRKEKNDNDGVQKPKGVAMDRFLRTKDRRAYAWLRWKLRPSHAAFTFLCGWDRAYHEESRVDLAGKWNPNGG